VSIHRYAGILVAGACSIASACGARQGADTSAQNDGGPSPHDGSVGPEAGSSGSGGGFGGSGSGGSGGSSSSGGNSGGSSGGGSGGSGGSSSGSGGSSGGTVVDGGPACTAPINAGAIALSPTNYVAASVIGQGGYAYGYDDNAGSTVCLDSTALCATGSTAVASSTVWGAGIGFNLDQAVGTMANPNPTVGSYAASGAGIAYGLSGLPSQGARILIDHAGTDYCAVLSAASGTLAWADFNTKCWDDSGTTLTGAPSDATHIEVQVVADGTTTPFSFCVDSIGFATTGSGSGSGGSSGSGSGGGSGSVCDWTSGPSSNDGELTCYWFGQGTSQGGGCGSYKTYCGYCGQESGNDNGGYCPTGITDTVANTGTQYFAAFPQSGEFGNGAYCGMCVEVTYMGRTVTATIVDECATCGGNTNHIDLSLGAAVALGLGQNGSTADPTSGVTWNAVSCPVTGDIVAVFNGSSSQIYFQNMTFPVASATAAGHTAHQDNAASGYWDFGADVGGATVTLTDTLGHTATGVIPAGGGTIAGAQFTDSCN
jgi:hypothetical protein